MAHGHINRPSFAPPLRQGRPGITGGAPSGGAPLINAPRRPSVAQDLIRGLGDAAQIFIDKKRRDKEAEQKQQLIDARLAVYQQSADEDTRKRLKERVEAEKGGRLTASVFDELERGKDVYPPETIGQASALATDYPGKAMGVLGKYKPDKPLAPTAYERLLRLGGVKKGSKQERDLALAKAAGQKISMTMAPDGTMSFEMGRGPGGGKAPSGNRLDDIRSGVDAMKSGIGMLDSMDALITEDPSRSGVVASIKTWTQDAAAMAEDMGNWARATFDTDFGLGNVSKGVDKLFDPNLPKMELFENSLAYSLAKARKPNKILNKQDIQLAKQDVKFKGLTSSRAVRSKIETLRAIFKETMSGYQRRLGVSAKDQSDDDIMRIIRERLSQ